MKSKKNKNYNTIADLAKELGVSIDTVRRYIKKGMLPRPRRVFFGTVGVAVFNEKYISDARRKLKGWRKTGAPISNIRV
ncbi:MerR family DNA-binding transcriptional regulator [Bradyrhizobium diazoefficiens]